MTGKKDFESFDERKIPETFSFSESENTKKFLSEDFVFKFEDNPKQTGIDTNDFDLGVEDNETKKAADDNFDEIKDAASNSSSSESSEASSSSSSPSSSSSSGSSSGSAASSSSGVASSGAAAGSSGTIATVAATVTTAVVLVVGGGLAIGQTIERPNICNLSDVVVVENKISFALGVGRNQEEIDNDNGSECDIRVELTCPGNADFLQEVKTDHFGKLSGEFTELEYDTEYLLDVRQHVFLSVDAESLLEKPISVKTASKDVPPEPEPVLVNSVNIYKDVDPMGGEYYYAGLTINNPVESYASYYIGLIETSSLRNANGDTGTSGGGDSDSDYPDQGPGFIEYSYRTEIIEGKVPEGKLAFSEMSGSQLTESSYTAGLVGITEEGEETTLFSTELTPSQFIATNIRQDKTIYFKYVYDMTKSEATYYAYIAYDDEEAYIYNILGTFVDPENPETQIEARFGMSKINQEEEVTLDALQEYGIYRPFEVHVAYVYNDPATGEEHSEEFMTLVDFSQIPSYYIESEKPTFHGANFSIGMSGTGSTSVMFVNLVYDDPSEVWTDMTKFHFAFTNVEDESDYIYSYCTEYEYTQFGETYYYLSDISADKQQGFIEKTYEVSIDYDYNEVCDHLKVKVDNVFTLDCSVELSFMVESEVADPSDPLTYKLHSFMPYDQYQIYFENVNDSSDNFTETLSIDDLDKTIVDNNHTRSLFYDEDSGVYKTYTVTTIGINEDDPNNPITLFAENIDFSSVSDTNPSPTVDASFSFGTNGMGTKGILFVTFDTIHDEFGYLDSEGYTIDIYDSQSNSYYGEIKTWPYDETGRLYVNFLDEISATFFEGGAEYSYDIHNGNYTVASSTLTDSDLVSQFTIPGSAAYKWESDAENTYLAYYLESNSFYNDFDYVMLSFSYTPATGGGERSLFDLTVEGYDTYIITTETYDSLSSYTDVTVKAIGYKDGNGTTIYTEIIDFSTLV